MIAALGFVLACAALAALVGAALSLAVVTVLGVTRAVLSRLPAARQADVLFIAGLIPAAGTLAIVGAAALPSLQQMAGVADDHCLEHAHHSHLCLVHFGGMRPSLAVLGAFALAWAAFRLATILSDELVVSRRLRQLQALASSHDADPALWILPGAASICHTVGLIHPRILVSSELLAVLSPAEREAVLAHERAHARRRDPLALFLLRLAGVFGFPFASSLLVQTFREAAELACDADAAHRTGDPLTVADVLVRVSRMRLVAPTAGAFAVAGSPLERRIAALLDPAGLASRRSHQILLGLSIPSVAVALALLQAPTIHHAVESALHHLF